VEHRFDQIDARLAGLERGQDELREGLAEMRGGHAELHKGQAELREGQAELRKELRGEVARLDQRIDTLDRHMHVLHEDTISRIAAISAEPLATRAEMQRGFDELKQLITRSIRPLELVVRQLVRERNTR
jgi:chaperonin cofactor prefoldin